MNPAGLFQSLECMDNLPLLKSVMIYLKNVHLAVTRANVAT